MPYSDSCCNAQNHFHLHNTCCQFQFKPNSKPLPYNRSFHSATVSCRTVIVAETLNTIFHLHTTCCQFQFKPNSKPLPYSRSFHSATVSCRTVRVAVTLNTISIYTPLAVSFNSNPTLRPYCTADPFTKPLSHAVQ